MTLEELTPWLFSRTAGGITWVARDDAPYVALTVTRWPEHDPDHEDHLPGKAAHEPWKHGGAPGYPDRIVDHVERAGQAGNGELVLVDLRVIGSAVLEVGVVRPHIADVAAHSKNAAPALVTKVGDTRAAFGVAPEQLEEGVLQGDAHPAHVLDEVVGTRPRGRWGPWR